MMSSSSSTADDSDYDPERALLSYFKREDEDSYPAPIKAAQSGPISLQPCPHN